tara:strand:+ start:635 stop:844 length:210 start_codon:yes stop_codon:yes gene_type:complete
MIMMSYEQYVKQVDRILARNLEGLTTTDLPDVFGSSTRDYYDSEMSPSECAEEIISSAFDGMIGGPFND